jgi:predicted Zn-dependent protease with MMP-like domain
MRGPAVYPPALGGVRSLPPRPTRRERFDEIVLAIGTEVERRWTKELGPVEYAVEDTPLLPHDWGQQAAPLSSLVRGNADRPHRMVLFRRPIEHRCTGREELEALILTLIVEQIAELLGIDADDVDPRYESD